MSRPHRVGTLPTHVTPVRMTTAELAELDELAKLFKTKKRSSVIRAAIAVSYCFRNDPSVNDAMREEIENDD